MDKFGQLNQNFNPPKWVKESAEEWAEFWADKKIGLLGGSFNPAHEAHLEISKAALEKCDLDYIWWMVSPGNPLKEGKEMAPLSKRLEWAKITSSSRQIFVTDIESKIGTQYTIDTLQKIKNLCPKSHFVWLMGADNLAQFDRWRDWKEIASDIPIAVFDRPMYSDAQISSIAANHLRKHQISERNAANIAELSPPAWVFCHGTNNPISATKIRKTHKFFEKQHNNQEVTKHKVSNTNKKSEGKKSSAALLELIMTSIEDSKAEDIVNINLSGKSAIADSMIICTGRSTRQVAAIAETLYRTLKQNDYTNCRMEGQKTNDWVLVDAVDVIIHVFRPEVRTFYNLEKMWQTDFRPENTELPNAQSILDASPVSADPIAENEEDFNASDKE
jgi:nicotinate-nucleotide adenylyltransferase